MAEPNDYCPEMPLGDIEVGTILTGIGEDLQKNGDREKARQSIVETLTNHLVKNGSDDIPQKLLYIRCSGCGRSVTTPANNSLFNTGGLECGSPDCEHKLRREDILARYSITQTKASEPQNKEEQ